MKIREILNTKGRGVVTIEGDRPVLDAVRILVERNIGGLVVVDGDGPIGILTERDVLRLTARAAGQLGAMRIDAEMTRELVMASPDDDLLAVMQMMTSHRVRHLPIMDQGRLAGIVSIGDLLNVCRQQAEEENAHLRAYIQEAR